MKYLILGLLFFSLNVVAQSNCTDTCGVTAEQRTCVKKSVKPRVITKVVPVIKEVVVTKTVTVTKRIAPRKNRISILVGHGAKEGLSRENNSSNVTVRSKVGVIGGLQYQRLVTNRVSLGAEVLSSKAALVSVGLEF
jgi:hypothetical protein